MENSPFTDHLWWFTYKQINIFQSATLNYQRGIVKSLPQMDDLDTDSSRQFTDVHGAKGAWDGTDPRGGRHRLMADMYILYDMYISIYV